MMMRPACFVALFIAAGCGGDRPGQVEAAGRDVAPGEWAVDYDASELAFVGSQTGKEFCGRFEEFSARIVFDPEAPENAKIEVTIDMDSAKTGDRQRDTALPRAEWFKAEEYPAATFVSSRVESAGDGAYEAFGALTIRDVTKDIALPFTLEIEGDAARATGAVDILRSDFGVGQGADFETAQWVAFEVRVEFDLRAVRR